MHGGRALFVVSFVQHALARYNYVPKGVGIKGVGEMRIAIAGHEAPLVMWLNGFFWHAISLGGGAVV